METEKFTEGVKSEIETAAVECTNCHGWKTCGHAKRICAVCGGAGYLVIPRKLKDVKRR